MKLEVQAAFAALKKALEEDPDYAYGWHCNIAMSCLDAIQICRGKQSGSLVDDKREHKIANDAASRFMKSCFDVETKFRG